MAADVDVVDVDAVLLLVGSGMLSIQRTLHIRLANYHRKEQQRRWQDASLPWMVMRTPVPFFFPFVLYCSDR